MNHCNQIWLEGTLITRQPLRYTPAGMPVTEAVIAHESAQSEAGQERKIVLEACVVALGENAKALSGVEIGKLLAVKGFLAAQSMRRRQDLVLHIEEFELLN